MMTETRNTPALVKGLPYPFYWTLTLLLLLAGIGVMIYLAVSHYRVYTDIGYQSFCAISRTINCDTVSQSRYAVMAGLPLAVWGVCGYLLSLALFGFAPVMRLRPGRDPEAIHVWSLFFIVSGGYALFSVVLGYISSVYISAYCIMCIAGWVINLALFYCAYLIRRRFEGAGPAHGVKKALAHLLTKRRRAASVVAGVLLTVVISLRVFYPDYWEFRIPTLPAHIPTGVTADGHPWIGADEPEIEIVEFSDYICFQCFKVHFFLRRLVERHPDKIRLVHRHFPMDHQVNPMVTEPFHPGSGALALLTIHAAEQGKFWEVNDILFAMVRRGGDIDVRPIAEWTGLDPDELARAPYNLEYRRRLHEDIMFGMANDFRGTPAFLVDEQVYTGMIPPEVFRGVVR